MRVQEVADALHDDAGLARAGAGNDHHWAVAVLDDRPLLGRQREVGALGGSRRRYGDGAFPPVRIVPDGAVSSLRRSGYIPYVRSAFVPRPRLGMDISRTIYSLTRADDWRRLGGRSPWGIAT